MLAETHAVLAAFILRTLQFGPKSPFRGSLGMAGLRVRVGWVRFARRRGHCTAPWPSVALREASIAAVDASSSGALVTSTGPAAFAAAAS